MNDFEGLYRDYQFLFEASDTAMIILNKDGMYLDHNQAYREMMGYTDKDDLIQFHPEDVSAQYQPNGVRSEAQVAINNGKAFTLGRYEFPWLHERPDGTQFMSYVILEKLVYDGQDCLWVRIHDIDEKEKINRLVEETTREIINENSELNVIFQNSLVGLVHIDDERIIRKCNPRFIEIFEGESKSQIIGQKTRLLYKSDEDYNEFGRFYKDALSDGDSFRIEYEFAKLNGKPMWCALSGSSLNYRDSYGIDGIIWVIDDITKQKEMEKALAEQYTIARDANPLTGLPGNNTIKKRIKTATEQESECCILYVDLDDFKAYNDKYGFAKGDDVIKFIADLLVDVLGRMDVGRQFIGHIGGDDFVMIFHHSYMMEVVDNLIKDFDQGIRAFYNEEDIEAKQIISTNRKGEMKTFPIMGVSIAGVTLKDVRELNHIQVIDMCVELKKQAKMTQGSCFAANRRLK